MASDKLRGYFERLIAGEQLVLVERSRSGDGGIYQAVRLTDRGRDILAGSAPIPGNEEPNRAGPGPRSCVRYVRPRDYRLHPRQPLAELDSEIVTLSSAC